VLQPEFQMDSIETLCHWPTHKTDIEYPFEHGKVINYTLDGVSIHQVTTKIQAPFLTQLPETKVLRDFIMVTLQQLQSLMAVIGEN
jgi:hypothetical protein